jgi:branched-chain amino acid transport system permease protein
MTITAVVLGLLYILMASGFNLVFGILETVNFAHGTIYMLGAHFVYWFMNSLGLNYFLAAIISVALAFALGWICEKVLLRGVRGDMLGGIIITLGLLLIFQAGAQIIWGEFDKAVSPPVTGVINIGGAVLPWEKVLPMVMAVWIMILIYWFLMHTKMGRSLRAVINNREVAALMGINIGFSYSLGFALGGILAAVAGILIAPLWQINATMGSAPLWKTFIVVILGGMGSVSGCVIAGIILGIIDSFVTTLVSSAAAHLLGFAIIIGILIFRPQGLMGVISEV